MASKSAPKKKRQAKRLDSDPEEYKRFLEVAREIGTSDDPKDFDKAFKKVVAPKRS